MTASPKPPYSGRTQLGAPIVPMNPSGRYLRHRVAAERAQRARRRSAWRRRALASLGIVLLYFAIGRDLLALATAKKGTVEMEVRHEVSQLGDDLRGLAGGASLDSNKKMSPLAFTSGAALVEAAAEDSPEAALLLSEHPIETSSRAP